MVTEYTTLNQNPKKQIATIEFKRAFDAYVRSTPYLHSYLTLEGSQVIILENINTAQVYSKDRDSDSEVGSASGVTWARDPMP